ncbi:helix-turn-helix domain-containing protein, partial [Deinococcus cellulosilyticus]
EAVRRFQQPGHVQDEIARDLGVSKTTVSLWKKRWREQGAEGLKATVGGGPPPRTFDVQRFEEDLAKGAKHFNYPTDGWSTRRITEMLYLTQDVKFHSQHMRRILHQLGYSHQKVAVQSRERNQELIDTWVKSTLPDIKKKAKGGKSHPGGGR